MRSEPWIVVIDSAPDDADGREMLELVLAGATLEVTLAVVFREAGLDLFEPERFRPWRQLVDHRLATLYGRSRRSKDRLPEGVLPLSDSEYDRLCGTAAGVLRL